MNGGETEYELEIHIPSCCPLFVYSYRGHANSTNLGASLGKLYDKLVHISLCATNCKATGQAS